MQPSSSTTAGPPTTAETAILEPSPSPGRRVARAFRRAGIDLLYLSLGLLSAVVAFVVWVTGLSVALSLAPFIVGFAVAIGCAYVFRLCADLDRRLAALVTGERIERRYRTVPAGTGWLGRLRILLGDSQTWRDLAWLIVHSVVGFGFGVAAITIAATVAGLILIPAWWFYLPEGDPMTFGLFEVDSTAHAFLASAIGLAAVPPAIGLLRLLAWLESSLAHSLLAPHSRRELEQRVEHLATTRAGLADASRADLARVERDLHDGAQARIVALAMELGMAEETVASDPEAAREMVARARAEALNALGELRDLARGLRPAVLAERGLAEAVEGLANRSPIPVSTRVRGDLDDLPQRTESAAYYVVAEALTNANKHSGASAVHVSLVREGDRLTVETRDDGGGGADPVGNGLDGLRRRVAALDGTFELRSPPGGPTTIRTELPCG